MNQFRCLTFGLALTLAGTAMADTGARKSAFSYNGTTGFLDREIIEQENSDYCLVTTYVHDGFGNRVSATTRNCNGSTAGGVTEAPAPAGDAVFASRTSTTSYAASPVPGQFATSGTNALGQAEAREFDPRFGGITKLTGPNGLVTTWVYDEFGRKVLETRADGTTTSWAFADCSGNCPTHAKYFITETTTGAPVRKTYFDALNRAIRTENQGFEGTPIYTDSVYDSQGRVTQSSKPYYGVASPTIVWTAFTYDTLGRVIQADEPPPAASGPVARTSTVFNGLTTQVTTSNAGTSSGMPEDAMQTRTIVRNSQGQAMSVTDTLGNVVSYVYDAFGNLKKTTAAGVETNLGYDPRGRKISMTDPDMGSWTYAYNALGELVRQTDAKSQVTTMTYDLLGRMTSRSATDLSSTWTYDSCTKGVGKLCQAAASGTATSGYARTLGYDALGRVASLGITIEGTAYSIGYSYDSAGRLDVATYPTGFAVKNNYNGLGYLASVQRTADPDATVYWQATSLNAAGQVLSETLGNNLVTTRTYDALFRLNEVKSTEAGVPAHRFTYGFDPIGNVTSRVDHVNAVTEAFAYDKLNRLLSAKGAGPDKSFTYSALGNVATKSDAGTYTYPAATAPLPHAVSSVAGAGLPGTITATFGYDPNGSLIDVTNGTIYPTAGGSVAFSRALTYTSFNMPRTVAYTQGADNYGYTYFYNSEHERVRLETVRPTGNTTSIYVHPAGRGALFYERETRASDGRLEHKHYVNGGGGLVGVFVTKSAYDPGDGPEMRYYLRDQIGSIAAIANPAATVVERFGYEAFGERRQPNGNPQDRASPLIGVLTDRGFTAHEHLDEMNLIHMNGRIYDPALGRFMTADPFVQSPGDLQSYNRYTYVLNNPLMYTDPSGYSLRSTLRNLTTKVLGEVGGVKYIGGLGQLGLLTNWQFGAAYGWSTGDWKSVATAHAHSTVLVAGALFLGWAAAPESAGGLELSGLELYGAHAGVGCATGATIGDGCGPGAASAVAGKWATVQYQDLFGKSLGGQFVTAMAAGGTASVVGGGRFANGAITGAFGYLFNACSQGRCWVTDEERALAAQGKYVEYWKTACAGGDSYACRAAEVSQAKGFWGSVATGRLQTFLKNSGVIDWEPVLDRVRVDIVRADVQALDASGATASDPRPRSEEDINRYHEHIFRQSGVPGAWAGRWRLYNFCPDCGR